MNDRDWATLDYVHLESESGPGVVRRRRILYGTTALVLVAVMVAAVVDSRAPVFGVDTATTRAEGGGYRLEVRYGALSRPGLATPFHIVVERPGGFDATEIDIAVPLTYIDMWDENGLNPGPTEETVSGDRLVWTFSTPEDSDRFEVSFDARIEPATQTGRDGSVAIVGPGGDDLAGVSFRTELWP